MRTVKDAETRKNEILDVAEKLFAQKGFESASTNDILSAVGIARGTLYYHFKSKEDIMDAIIDRFTKRIVANVKEAASEKKLTLEERVMKAVLGMNIVSAGEVPDSIMDEIHKPQNALMHSKIQTQLQTEIVPIFTELVNEGIEKGIFSTPYPKEAVEMLLIYTSVAFDDEAGLDKTETARKSLAAIYNFERLLGAKEGSLMFLAKAMIK